MNRNKTILIVGGTGFIGKHLVYKARKLNMDIIVLTKSGKKPSEKIFKSVKFIKCDFTKQKQLCKKLSSLKINYLINVGGYINHALFYSKKGKSSLIEHFDAVRNLVSCIYKSKMKKNWNQNLNINILNYI